MANATLDPITGLPSSNTQSASGVVTSNPITPESLTTPKALQTVTRVPDTTNHAAITDSVSQSIANDYKTFNDQYNSSSKNLTDSGTGIIDVMKELQGKAADTKIASETAGVNTALDEVNKNVSYLADLNGQAQSLNREAKSIPLVTADRVTGLGVTTQAAGGQNEALLRANAIKALSIAQQSDITSAALTGSQVRLKAAEDKRDQIISLKYAPMEADLALKQKQYDLNKDTLMLVDKKRTEALGIALQKEKDDLAAKKDLETKISSVQLEAAKNGASPQIQAAITGAQSVGEAIKAAGSSLAAPNTEIVKVGDNAAYLIDKKTGKIIKSYGGGGSGTGAGGSSVPRGAAPTVGALASLAPLVSGFPSVTAQKTFVSAINNLAQKPGSEKAIAEKMVGTVIDNISDTNTRKLVSGDFALATQLTRMQGLLDDYVAAGGETSFIKGKKEGGYQYVGKTTDPALAKIGVQLANQLDELARTRTGAVVSASEEASFGKMLPGIGKSPELNTALTSGLKTSLMSNVETSLRYAVTSDGVRVIKSALPEVFGDYRSANPTIQLKSVYTSSPQNKATVDQIRKDHPTWGATEIMQVYNGQ